MDRRRKMSPLALSPLVHIPVATMQPVPTYRDTARMCYMTAGGPLPLTGVLFVEQRLLREMHQPTIAEVLTALNWGYMVRIVPRLGGPCAREVCDG